MESRLQGDRGGSRVKDQEATGHVKDDGDTEQVAGVEAERIVFRAHLRTEQREEINEPDIG